MLVLSRKIGECVVIDKEIVIKVLQVQGNKIRLGIEAPPYVEVLRKELFETEANERVPCLASNLQAPD